MVGNSLFPGLYQLGYCEVPASLFIGELGRWAHPSLVGSCVVDRLATSGFHLLLFIGRLILAGSALSFGLPFGVRVGAG